ncbi:hypothetical protein [Reinekea marinisedimentorum]|uniref:Uncharacterized protein n=1 Tax=Reinekea marinisedimentorum TaxID=230495 RepID=A0A4R3I5K8_9GAMM|nr:hypothetical protein [Reinekea marinisedimentorum]TCS40411.1 hypothetical protein BCF53_109121 [Reinekea marinisedimentorum]
MTDRRPDFDSETFTPYELYERNSFEFGFLMKSWSQPFYGGSIVKVYGWSKYEAVNSKQGQVLYLPFPSLTREEYKHPETGNLTIPNQFVCSRNFDENRSFMIIENVAGKGWLPHDEA